MLCLQDRDSFFSSLPELSLAEGYRQDSYLCWNIKQILGKGTKFFAVCPLSSAWKDSDYNTQQSVSLYQQQWVPEEFLPLTEIFHPLLRSGCFMCIQCILIYPNPFVQAKNISVQITEKFRCVKCIEKYIIESFITI